MLFVRNNSVFKKKNTALVPDIKEEVFTYTYFETYAVILLYLDENDAVYDSVVNIKRDGDELYVGMRARSLDTNASDWRLIGVDKSDIEGVEKISYNDWSVEIPERNYEHLSDDELLEIREKFIGDNTYSRRTVGNILHLGTYDCGIVVFPRRIRLSNESYLRGGGEEIGIYWFRHSDERERLYLYKDGKFMLLYVAYRNGLLTDDEIGDIYRWYYIEIVSDINRANIGVGWR